MLEVWIAAAFFAASVAIVANRLAGWRQREREILNALQDVQATRIAAVRDGNVVKVVGELLYWGRPIVAPLSGRTCAFYSLVILKCEPPFSSGPQEWVELLREERGVDFLVGDGSGVALVRAGVEGTVLSSLVPDKKGSKTSFPNDGLRRLVVDRGLERPLSDVTLRAYEGVLEAGDRVAVGGLGRWHADPEGVGGYREAGLRLVLQGSNSLPLFISDDPKAL
ncbi:MAG TPA: hypothetical protein VH877_17605 [Polyangia bacterium]|nr:hypothetical protein [Polyangia bacterium]